MYVMYVYKKLKSWVLDLLFTTHVQVNPIYLQEKLFTSLKGKLKKEPKV